MSDRDAQLERFSELSCVSFSSGVMSDRDLQYERSSELSCVRF